MLSKECYSKRRGMVRPRYLVFTPTAATPLILQAGFLLLLCMPILMMFAPLPCEPGRGRVPGGEADSSGNSQKSIKISQSQGLNGNLSHLCLNTNILSSTQTSLNTSERQMPPAFFLICESWILYRFIHTYIIIQGMEARLSSGNQ